MPGYVAASKLTSANYLDTVDHDLAVLTLSEPLDLDGDDARVAYLPSASTPMPGRVSRLVLAGFGNEKPSTYAKSAGDEDVPVAVEFRGWRSGCDLQPTRIGASSSAGV